MSNMEPVKGFFDTIFEINETELEALMKRFDNKECTSCDKQLYIYQEPATKKYIAIDNTSGDMYMEEFTIKEDAYIFLLGLKASEVLQKAEEYDFWW